jgi:hypothetical protein
MGLVALVEAAFSNTTDPTPQLSKRALQHARILPTATTLLLTRAAIA